MTKPQCPSFFSCTSSCAPVWCFVRSLFNLQDTRSAYSRNIWYFTTTDFVCQELFSTFFTFLKPFVVSRHHRRLIQDITSEPLCQELFYRILNFFRSSVSLPPALADSFVRIPPLSPFVNTFFSLFSSFLSLSEDAVMSFLLQLFCGYDILLYTLYL